MSSYCYAHLCGIEQLPYSTQFICEPQGLIVSVQSVSVSLGCIPIFPLAPWGLGRGYRSSSLSPSVASGSITLRARGVASAVLVLAYSPLGCILRYAQARAAAGCIVPTPQYCIQLVPLVILRVVVPDALHSFAGSTSAVTHWHSGRFVSFGS